MVSNTEHSTFNLQDLHSSTFWKPLKTLQHQSCHRVLAQICCTNSVSKENSKALFIWMLNIWSSSHFCLFINHTDGTISQTVSAHQIVFLYVWAPSLKIQKVICFETYPNSNSWIGYVFRIACKYIKLFCWLDLNFEKHPSWRCPKTIKSHKIVNLT